MAGPPGLRLWRWLAPAVLLHVAALEWMARESETIAALQPMGEVMYTRMLQPVAPPPPPAAVPHEVGAAVPQGVFAVAPPRTAASAPNQEEAELAAADAAEPAPPADAREEGAPAEHRVDTPPAMATASAVAQESPASEVAIAAEAATEAAPAVAAGAAAPPAANTDAESPAASAAHGAAEGAPPSAPASVPTPPSSSAPAPSSASAPSSAPVSSNPQGAPASLPAGTAGTAGTAASPLQAVPASDTWPRDTRLNYRLGGQFRSGQIYGDARVLWQRDGTRYQVQVDLDITLFARMIITSQGEVTPEGLQPQAYEEVRPGRKRRGATFGRQQVVLDNGSNAPRPAGMQDAASQFVELAHRFATGRETLAPGRTVDLWLGRPGGVDLWTYDVVGLETLQTPGFGAVHAWRLKPRPISKPRGKVTAEMWFAPSLQYLPVRIRIWTGDDAVIDLLAEKIEQR